MATIRLIPSTSAVSNASYASIADASNMYTNTDSSTYGTFTHNRASTNNTYYGYLRGFNFDDIPDNATVTSFTVKIRASATGHTTSTSSSYYMSLVNNTTQIGSTTASGRLSTSVTTFTFANGSLTWDTIVGYGANFGIRIPLRRASSNTADVVSVYGAEIDVTYTVPIHHSVTIQNSTSANVQASDTNPYEGDDVVISTNTLTGLTIKDNGTDVTNQFVQATGGTVSAVPESTFTTGFSTSGANFYQNSSTTSTSWLEYAIGHSAESPYSTSNTSNTYVKPERATGWINYEFDFSEIPASATINSVSVKVYGAREDSTVDSTHVARFQCYSGNTAKGTLQDFTSTSNGSVTVSDVGTWTAAELHDAILRFEIGYYGGRMLGITWTVTYTVSGYVYTITAISTDHTIVVTESSPTPIPVTGVEVTPSTASIDIGGSITLTATVLPNTATNKSVTWSTSSASIATVSNGVVTGISSGTARITATTVDGGYTDYCDVTVSAAVTYEFVQANSMQVGKQYLISDGNSGTVHLLTGTSAGSRLLQGVTATVSNGKITITGAVKDSALFNCVRYTTGNDVTITVSKDNKYLYSDSATGLRMNAPTTLDRFWHYRDNKFWQFKSTTTDGYTDTSSEYKYYLELSNGNFTDNHVTSPSIQDTNIPAIYIWTESTGQTDFIYFKNNGSWVEATSVYKKVNGSWVLQADLTTVFDANTNYVKG